MVYSTYMGGHNNDWSHGIAVDMSGNAYIAGRAGPAFPIVNAIQPSFGGVFNDCFITKLNPYGTTIIYSTYLGGAESDIANGIAVDSSGNAYVTGKTVSTNFPTVNPLQSAVNGNGDAFVAKISEEVSNSVPVLDQIGNKIIDEGQLLEFTISANDPNIGDTLTFSAINLPDGADFDEATQVFFWTPTFEQTGDFSGISFTVTDDGTPFERASETITITVNDVNRPPVAQCQDIIVETGPGICASIASIDNGSTDPDGDPVDLVLGPSGPYSAGETQVTLTVTDDKGQSDSCSAIITVLDVEHPIVAAEFVPFTNDDSRDDNKCNGAFIVNFSASDNCDSDVTFTAELNGVSVDNGILVKLHVSKNTKTKMEKDGTLDLKAPSFGLVVTTTDRAGNESTITVDPFEGLICDDNDSGDGKNDEDEDSKDKDEDSKDEDEDSKDKDDNNSRKDKK